MAVKKTKTAEVEVKVDVVENTEQQVTQEVEETPVAPPVVEEVPVVEIPEQVAEEPKKVEVDTAKSKVDNSKKPQERVKIRMRVDHSCCIAMERYNLKAGKTYTVPENVKRILNKAGLLAPL